MNRAYVPGVSGPATAAVALLAGLVSAGLLSLVADIMSSRGAPLSEWAAAERACNEHRFVSEREACIRATIVAARAERVARRSRSD